MARCKPLARPACIRRAERCRRRRPRWRRRAMIMPSMSWCGSPSISSRSLNVPGSISSALATRYLGCGASSPIGTKLHFMPGGKAGAAAAAQIRVLHLVRDRLRRHAAAAPCAAPGSRRRARRLARSSGCSVRPDVLGQRFLHRASTCSAPACWSIFSRVEVAVQIVVDHHGRRVIAGAQADDRQQREAAVGGGFAEPDAEPLREAARACGRSP